MGYDHGTCDTSMFHRGCLWDVYKMDMENYRRPDVDSGIWGFQWTTRDILNTVHCPGGISGAAIFSTDADDIFFHNILQTEKEYYKRMLECYKGNMDSFWIVYFRMKKSLLLPCRKLLCGWILSLAWDSIRYR